MCDNKSKLICVKISIQYKIIENYLKSGLFVQYITLNRLNKSKPPFLRGEKAVDASVVGKGIRSQLVDLLSVDFVLKKSGT